MLLPTLPTDNLYKFIFIGGMTLAITCIILDFNLQKEQDKEGFEIVLLQDKLSVELKIEVEKHMALMEIEKMRSEHDDADYYHDSIQMFNSVKSLNQLRDSTSKKGLTLINEFEKRSLSNLDSKQKFDLVRKEIKTKMNLLEIGAKRYNNHLFALRLLGFIGMCLAWIGFNKWEKYVQRPLDERTILELVILRQQVSILPKTQEESSNLEKQAT